LATRGKHVLSVIQHLCIQLVVAVTLYPQTLPVQRGFATAVQGESWLSHLHRPFQETAMGKTGQLGPGPEEREVAADLAPSFPLLSSSEATVTLRGADLYRLNCQGCHGESGLGAPPEIGSMINPVRATSVHLVMQRMKSVGANISHAQAMELARQSKAALLHRIHHGGQDMPSFSYLSEYEVRSLLSYLNLLAGVPQAASQQVAVRESHSRIGELIAKSTCHICHDATGANTSPAELAAGSIPPLATLIIRTGRAGLIRKVTRGAPALMGSPPMSLRGRMPVFFYLRDTEAADVYQYLEAYPPSVAQNASTGAQAQTLQPSSILALPTTQPVASQLPPNAAESTLKNWFLSLTFGCFVLLGAGFVLTLREFKRLSAEAQKRRSLLNRSTTATLPVPIPSASGLKSAE